jgi:hypothetical protein
MTANLTTVTVGYGRSGRRMPKSGDEFATVDNFEQSAHPHGKYSLGIDAVRHARLRHLA